MLNILGNAESGKGFCDGINRRNFLKIGGMALGGLSLPQLLAAEAKAGTAGKHKSIINIYLPGGPPHQDMWDLKPEAPSDIRGEFNPIKTNVPGIEICELFPCVASMMDKFVPIRTMVGAFGAHDGYQCMTGRVPNNAPAGGWPAAGAWVSRLQGPVNRAVPAHLSLMYRTGERRWGQPGDGGFLGSAHAPFSLLGTQARSVDENMTLHGITLERLQDRDSLRQAFDQFRRKTDANASMQGLDIYAQQALGILTSSAMSDALDLSKEDPKVVERYGKSDTSFQRDGAPRMVENFCIARRLVEAGARVVTMNFSRWDWHGPDGKNFVQARIDMPLLDRALAALVSDLDERGRLNDTSIVVWGEFGRTPKINKDAGRDHWPQVSCAMLAGGGIRAGQVIGQTDRNAGEATRRPVSFQEVFATLFHNVGINVNTATADDLRGRPMYSVENGVQPLRELVG